ncbi:hypothetical protein EU513_13370 [Yimella sp. RIT 621]|uniref:hypothetical protein n=1 Tax=Yimella sp. RIT 621 TaxID=2510323 RepID=UPI00101DB1E9|nr:hypothetical protein [Yimella sp. RIT 621]RYG76175.1 hypothetical protein EU513_13370 [Yimella sp. RIT 621]
MSYDLGLWVGQTPNSDKEAADEFERRFAQAEDDDSSDAEPAIEAFVAEAVDKFPEFDDGSPWASLPVMLGATGDFISVSLTVPGAVHAAEIARIGASNGLVCYDPQREDLLP